MEFTELLEHFKKNTDEWKQIEAQVNLQYDMISWTQFLSNRSKKLRRIFSDNEKILANLRILMLENLTEESAEALYNNMLKLYTEAYDDAALYEIVLVPLLAYYREKKDYGKVVALTAMYAFELASCSKRYVKIDEELSDSAKLFLEALSYKDHYAEIESKTERKFFFSSYANLIAPLSYFSKPLQSMIYDLYDQALELWNRDEVQRLDGDDPVFVASIERIKEAFASNTEYILEYNEEMIPDFAERIDSILAEHTREEILAEPGSNLYISYYATELIKGHISRHKLVDIYVNELGYIQTPDYDNCDFGETQNYILDVHGMADATMFLLSSDEFSATERDHYLRKFLPQTIHFINAIPYNFDSSMVNELCISWYKNAKMVLPKSESKIDFLNKMIITRQPQTYIHSIMVAKIAAAIAEELIWKCPELLLEACDKASVPELYASRDRVMDYIYQCGLLHDVGKSQIADIINLQTRKLTDLEFSLIRQHPNCGKILLEEDSTFAPFLDVIVGHHKYYDGTYGYPREFDNSTSKKRFLIDLITIADCTDAATDILGRNYSTCKDFYTLLEELTAGAGTRYNPDIVKVISESQPLKESLNNLTSTGRYSIYYEAYHIIEAL